MHRRVSKKILVIYAPYDLTFPVPYSLKAIEGFKSASLDYEVRILPCGHYTTGETPFQYIDGWYMGSFVYRAFKGLRRERQEQEASVSEQGVTE